MSTQEVTACKRCPRQAHADNRYPTLSIVDGLCWACFTETVIKEDGETDSLLPKLSKCCDAPLRSDPRGFRDCSRCGREQRV